MALSAVLNPRFNKLNSNALRSKADFRTRERRAIVDITIPDSEVYVTGGVPLDLSVIRNFIEVYSAVIVNQPLLSTANLKFQIIPAADNKADGAKLGIVNIGDGAEFTNAADIGTGDIIITVEIIGI